MRSWKTAFARLLRLGLPWKLLLALFCVPALLCLFGNGLEDTAPAYPLYVLSAYTLASFGGEYEFQRLMNALTGGGVCLLIFLTAAVVALRANRAIGALEAACGAG